MKGRVGGFQNWWHATLKVSPSCLSDSSPTAEGIENDHELANHPETGDGAYLNCDWPIRILRWECLKFLPQPSLAGKLSRHVWMISPSKRWGSSKNGLKTCQATEGLSHYIPMGFSIYRWFHVSYIHEPSIVPFISTPPLVRTWILGSYLKYLFVPFIFASVVFCGFEFFLILHCGRVAIWI